MPSRLLLLAAFVAAAAPPVLAEETLYLRDGRRVTAQSVEEKDGWLTAETSFGRLTFPVWLRDDSAAAREAWARVKRFEKLDDPEFLEEIRLRREQWEKDRRGEGAKPPAEIKEVQESIDRLVLANDVAGLVEAARRAEAALGELTGENLEQGRIAAARAYREAARLEKKAAGDRPSPRAGELFLLAHRQLDERYGGSDGSEGVAAFARVFRDDDPCAWGPYARLMDSAEIYLGQYDPGAFGDDFRWNTEGAEWKPDEGGLPRKFRVVSKEGKVSVTEGPEMSEPFALSFARAKDRAAAVNPRAEGLPEKVASVWVPEVRQGGTSGVMIGVGSITNYESGWWRIYWCPVEKRWKDFTFPERIFRQGRVPAAEFVHGHHHFEGNEARSAGSVLKEYHSRVDSLARNAFDPETGRLISFKAAEAERGLAEAKDAYDRFVESHDRSLRRRARMQAGIERMRKADELLAEVLEGKAVDLAPIADPPPVRRPTEKPDEKEAILKALRAFSTETRFDTLRGSAVDGHARDPEISAALFEIVKDEFADSGQKEMAAKFLQKWGDAGVEAYLKGKIEEKKGTGETGEFTHLLEGSPEFWEEKARQAEDPALREEAIEKLGLHDRQDAAAAALVRLAPDFPTPRLQRAAMEAMRRTRKPEAAAAAVLKLRYPQAREEAYEMLKAHDDPRAPAVKVLLDAQEEAWKFVPGRRGGKKEEPPDPEEFQRKNWERVEADGGLEKIRAAGPEGFETELRELLGPRRLVEDRLLQDLFGGAANDSCEMLAELGELSDGARDWIPKAAKADPKWAENEKYMTVLAAIGDAETVEKCREAVKSRATEGNLRMYEAVKILGFAKGADAARFLIDSGLLDDRRVQGAVVEALCRITGREDLQKAEEWKAWDGGMGGR